MTLVTWAGLPPELEDDLEDDMTAMNNDDWRAVCVALVAKAISDGGLHGNDIELTAGDFLAVADWEFKVEMTETGSMRLTLKEPKRIISLKDEIHHSLKTKQ